MSGPEPALRCLAPDPEQAKVTRRLFADIPDHCEVACVALDASDAVVAASFVETLAVPLLGGELILLYDCAPASFPAAQADALLSATFAELDGRERNGPIGLVVLVTDPTEMARRPLVRWVDPPMLYMGYLDDGRQIRVGYFEGAQLGGDQA